MSYRSQVLTFKGSCYWLLVINLRGPAVPIRCRIVIHESNTQLESQECSRLRFWTQILLFQKKKIFQGQVNFFMILLRKPNIENANFTVDIIFSFIQGGEWKLWERQFRNVFPQMRILVWKCSTRLDLGKRNKRNVIRYWGILVQNVFSRHLWAWVFSSSRCETHR